MLSRAILLALAALAWCATVAPKCRCAEAPDGTRGARGAEPPPLLTSGSHRREFAVCVGVNGYQEGSGFGPLKYAGSDAISVAQALLEQCDFDKVVLITDAPVSGEFAEKYAGRLKIVESTTRQSIEDSARRFFFQATNDDDVALFYFAGHGMSDTFAYLLPSDFNATTAPENVIMLDNVVNYIIHRVRTNNRLIILDACRPSTEGRGSIIDSLFQDSLLRASQTIALWSACNNGESAAEDPKLEHGRFSWALVKALDGEAFKPGERNMDVGDVFDYIETVFNQHAADESWGRQSPQELAGFRPRFSLTFRDVEGAALAAADADSAVKSVEEWEALATRQYALNELEMADASCLRAMTKAAQAAAPAPATLGRLLARRALIQYRLGRTKDSDTLLQVAAGLAPGDASLLELSGYHAIDDKDYAKAAVSLGGAIESIGNEKAPPFLLLQSGICQYELERFDNARDSFDASARRCKELVGDSHPFYAESINNFAAANARAVRLAERQSSGANTSPGERGSELTPAQSRGTRSAQVGNEQAPQPANAKAA